MNERKISDTITVTSQPSAEELKTLAERGFRTVVNLRTANEPGLLEDEEQLAHDAGLNYAWIPTAPAILDDASVARFIQVIDSAGGQPALVHCKGGGRAGIMALLHEAVRHGWSVAQTLEEGAKLGIAPASDSPYRAFFEGYLRRHSAGER
jgi:cytochrome b6-f complex iron-sulfur subunit